MKTEEDEFVEKYAQRNKLIYIFIACFSAFTIVFCEPTILLANLAERLGAPAWLANLPAAATFTICFIPPFSEKA